MNKSRDRFIKTTRLMLALMLALMLLMPGTASATPINCKDIPHGQLCESSITGETLGRCDRGYWLGADWACYPLNPRPSQPRPWWPWRR